MLKAIFRDLLNQYEVQPSVSDELWRELKENYNQPARLYHNLNHLADLYDQLYKVMDKIEHWNTTLFTLFYHDVVYVSTKKNNEEKSAELAHKRMEEIGVVPLEINRCYNQIIATKSHKISEDSDTNYFNDVDLSILGRDWETYDQYCKKIRLEYSIYPNFLYRKGRKKVVQHFLEIGRLFKTEIFFEKFENQARANLSKELEQLKN